MINLKIILFQCFVLFALHGFSQNTKKLLEQELDNMLNQYHNNALLNGTVLVAKQGEVLYQKSFGKADISNNIQNTLETKFICLNNCIINHIYT